MRTRKWIIGGAAMVLAAECLLAAGAMAASTPKPTGAATTASSSGQGLEISPPVIELQANPGQTVTANIRVRNVAAGQLIAKGKADDFGAGSDESGQPKLLLDETGATRFSLKYWVQGVPDLRLAPQELKTATVTIRVPANAEPGGHFGVVRFTAVPPDLEGTGVALSASVGTLILLRVAGAITDDVKVMEFATLLDGQSTGFFERGPVDFVVRLKNDGSVHEKAQGTIDVTDIFGKKVAAVTVNDKGGNVLPASVRRFDERLDKRGLFGRYTAKLNLSYLEGTKPLQAKITFWVIPWKLILLVMAVLIALVWGARVGLKKYNEHIIAQARRR